MDRFWCKWEYIRCKKLGVIFMKVTFSSTHSAFSIKAPAGTLVSLTGTPTEVVDGVYTIGDEGCINIDEQMLTKDIYLSITGEDYTVAAGARIAYPAEGVEVRAGSSVLPFKLGAKGGGGGSGGGCTYRGTTTTAISNGSTTNPITIDGESYTAVFGDVVVYGYTEFVFDGTQWSEFGRPFDTVPTSGSTNAVTSDGVYRNTAGQKYYSDNAYRGEVFNDYERNIASGNYSHAEGYHTTASGSASHTSGYYTRANKFASTAIGQYNVADTDVAHLFIVGNGTSPDARSNILEVSETDVNVNGIIQRDGVGIDDYTTTERKIGKWIDGSDLYQRTFEVTGLTQGGWNAALGTSDIDIKAFDGYIRYLYNGEFNRNISLNYFVNSNECVVTQNSGSDLYIKPNRTESGLSIDKAVITIKYTKPSVQANALNTNIQQTEEPTEEPTDEMR
jgi:hypothetical protein